eukprot:TRINITY_DN18945_c0_g1_i2.p1 TRINITY_DN18945_c0_g1~~TRINITY_DN18945_c0_g1_i2.p1  ORF type:complete len:404 (+),score=79.73 TRINITY_DN18945_c0_g1_i2:173-1213(+)
MKSRKELGAYLANQKKALVQTPAGATPAAATQPPRNDEPTTVNPPADTAVAAPDAAVMASMGVLGTDVDSMNDAQELRNQVRMWEAKYKVLLDENKRLLMGKGVGAPVAGTIVPSDLQLKYDALLRQNNALHTEIDVKGNDIERLTRAVEDLTAHKSKLEVQLGEAYAQASEGLEAKIKLQEKDDIAQRAGDFVNEHVREQNKFLSAQVAELTALLHKIKEEDHFIAKAMAANEEPLPTAPLPAIEKAKVAVHFKAIVNTPARHVLCGKCRSTIARMIASEDTDTFAPGHIQPHSDGRTPTTIPYHPPPVIQNVIPQPAMQPIAPPPGPQKVAVGSYGGFVVRARQ